MEYAFHVMSANSSPKALGLEDFLLCDKNFRNFTFKSMVECDKVCGLVQSFLFSPLDL